MLFKSLRDCTYAEVFLTYQYSQGQQALCSHDVVEVKRDVNKSSSATQLRWRILTSNQPGSSGCCLFMSVTSKVCRFMFEFRPNYH